MKCRFLVFIIAICVGFALLNELNLQQKKNKIKIKQNT